MGSTPSLWIQKSGFSSSDPNVKRYPVTGAVNPCKLGVGGCQLILV